eukprot:6572854-Pyramimonas_sp.AAC.2
MLPLVIGGCRADFRVEPQRALLHLGMLLQVGFFHSDPHPGNLMRMNDQTKGKLALLDFGLVATVKQEDQVREFPQSSSESTRIYGEFTRSSRHFGVNNNYGADTIVSSIVHLANKDYTSLVDDFIKLEILPADCDRSK